MVKVNRTRSFFALWICLVGVRVSISSEPNRLTDQELAEGWILLFDGESLFGWRPACKADWQVREGTIVVTEGEVGLLRTTTQFSDYVVRVDFRCNPHTTNSGVFLRTPPKPQDPARDCYELNIAPADNPFPTGSYVKRKKVQQFKASDQWQTFEAEVNREHCTVKLNGQLVLDYVDPRPLGRGFIGLQHNSGSVEFRNVKLKPLGLKELLHGQNLDRWTTPPEQSAAKFEVNDDGSLRATGGPGHLETTSVYGDFVLQLQSRTNGKHLNSGVFFRCIPGERMNGYESQIHNGFHDDDRSKPVDCGTGGIFRRANARRVIPDDFQWFHKTIIAEGPHMAVWVNGYQVTDWTDKRKANANPRRGFRTEPGSIMLQAHDPTTDISFRKIRIAEMKKRWN